MLAGLKTETVYTRRIVVAHEVFRSTAVTIDGRIFYRKVLDATTLEGYECIVLYRLCFQSQHAVIDGEFHHTAFEVAVIEQRVLDSIDVKTLERHLIKAVVVIDNFHLWILVQLDEGTIGVKCVYGDIVTLNEKPLISNDGLAYLILGIILQHKLREAVFDEAIDGLAQILVGVQHVVCDILLQFRGEEPARVTYLCFFLRAVSQ